MRNDRVQPVTKWIQWGRKNDAPIDAWPVATVAGALVGGRALATMGTARSPSVTIPDVTTLKAGHSI
jgi:hypothetical protein